MINTLSIVCRSVKVFDSPSYLLLYICPRILMPLCCVYRQAKCYTQTSDDGELHPSRSVVLLLCNHLDHFVFEKKEKKSPAPECFTDYIPVM